MIKSGQIKYGLEFREDIIVFWEAPMKMLGEHLIKKLINNKNSIAENIQLYELLFQQLPCMSMLCDSNGNILKASETLYNIIQCTKEELTNQSIMDIILIEQNKKDSYYNELKRGNKVTIDCKTSLNNMEEKTINFILIPMWNRLNYMLL